MPQIVHATAASIEGPYTARGVAVDAFAANPQVVPFEDGDGRSKLALFHIGADAAPCDCSRGSVPSACCRAYNLSVGTDRAISGGLSDGAANISSVVRTAESPDGPWTVRPMRFANGGTDQPSV